MTQKRHSIKFRLIGLGISLILFGVVFRVFLALPLAQENLRELIGAQQWSIASYVARDVDNSIVARRRLIEQLGSTLTPDLLQQPAALERWVQERQDINPLFDRLIVLPPDGSGLLLEYPKLAATRHVMYTDADWFRAALASEGTVVSRPQRARSSGRPVIIMAKAIRDAEHRAVGVVAGVAVLNSPGFLNSLQVTSLGKTGGFLLVSPADKLFVGASDPGMVLTPTPPPGVNPLHDRAMNGFRGNGVTTNASGVEELSAMASVPSTGWFVVARMPVSEAYAPIAAARNLVLVGTVVSLLVLIVALLVLMPRILRPLTDMAASMRAMADGKRQLTALPVVRNDEVGDLVVGFNYLLARLNENETALKESEVRLSFMAHHDPLTGLVNRVILEERIDFQLAQAARGGPQLALLFCDLDGFKTINDRHGHKAGDAVLCEVAARLSAGRRRNDTVARFGGDEFIVLLSGPNDATDATDAAPVGATSQAVDTATAIAQQLLRAISVPFIIEGHEISLGVSVGIALSGRENMTASQLISRADIAMYQAKRAGKNGFCVFDAVV
jgi:diguanylate cyclase (GGDEF)-like protein